MQDLYIKLSEEKATWSNENVWNPDTGAVLKVPKELLEQGWIVVEEVRISIHGDEFTGLVELIRKKDAPKELINGDPTKGYEKVTEGYYRHYVPAIN